MDPNGHIPGPSLPSWFLMPATGVFALLTVYFMMRTRGRASRFLIFACWLRYTLSSLHEVTYNEAFLGMKWVAVGSLVIITTGILVLEKRRFLSRYFFPVALICFLMILSSTLNGSISSAIDPIVRFMTFVFIAVGVWQALETNGSTVLKRLLFVFIQPLTYQIASIVLHCPKTSDLDGGVSYIGGYYHDELFSLIGASAFVVAIFAGRLNKSARLLICMTALASIMLANYRTTMIGILPLALVALLTAIPRSFVPTQRALARFAVIISGVALLGVGATLASERFSDLQFVTEATSFMKPPEQYSYADIRVLSARPWIWSMYIYGYRDSTRLQKVVGLGPNSWQDKFPDYAHDTIISFLYELGILGVFAILLLWWRMFRLALSADRRSRNLLIGAHASFFVLNLATMAHWEVEGNILYGVLVGFTIAKARQAKASRVLAATQAARQRMMSLRGMPRRVPAPA